MRLQAHMAQNSRGWLLGPEKALSQALHTVQNPLLTTTQELRAAPSPQGHRGGGGRRAMIESGWWVGEKGPERPVRVRLCVTGQRHCQPRFRAW